MPNQRIKRWMLVSTLIIAACVTYFAAVNHDSKNMTTRQKILKAVYPAIMGFGQLFGNKNRVKHNETQQQPQVSFYTLSATGIDGTILSFKNFIGKKVLLVNTASDCGYTAQYKDLQQLHERFKDKLVIIGFPANDFNSQEKGTDTAIVQFCKVNYGVSFFLATKSSVVKSPNQNKVFEWLSDKTRNGWNDRQPGWNFSKYLVDEKGILTDYFDSSVSPLSSEMINAVSGKHT